jgi:hypothetical protein
MLTNYGSTAESVPRNRGPFFGIAAGKTLNLMAPPNLRLPQVLPDVRFFLQSGRRVITRES